jgi:hypothetical protein
MLGLNLVRTSQRNKSVRNEKMQQLLTMFSLPSASGYYKQGRSWDGSQKSWRSLGHVHYPGSHL